MKKLNSIRLLAIAFLVAAWAAPTFAQELKPVPSGIYTGKYDSGSITIQLNQPWTIIVENQFNSPFYWFEGGQTNTVEMDSSGKFGMADQLFYTCAPSDPICPLQLAVAFLFKGTYHAATANEPAYLEGVLNGTYDLKLVEEKVEIK